MSTREYVPQFRQQRSERKSFAQGEIYMPRMLPSPWIAARAAASDEWPYTSPVMLMELCPSRSLTCLMWTPDAEPCRGCAVPKRVHPNVSQASLVGSMPSAGRASVGAVISVGNGIARVEFLLVAYD
jgi:hypothetical protein